MSVKPTWFGFNVPFLGGSQNVMSKQTDERLIKNDLLQLLLTVPGERVYRPRYGAPIRSMIFENVDDDSTINIRTAIVKAIRDYEERVTVNDVTVSSSDDGQVLNILIDVSPNNNPLTHYLIELGIGPNGQVQMSR